MPSAVPSLTGFLALVWVVLVLRIVTLRQPDPTLKTWSGMYSAYVLFATDWNPSALRYYLLALPVFWPLTIPGLSPRRSRIAGVIVLAVLGLISQWWWIRYVVTLTHEGMQVPDVNTVRQPVLRRPRKMLRRLRLGRPLSLLVAHLLEHRARLRRWPALGTRIRCVHVELGPPVIVAIAQLTVAHVVPTGRLLTHASPKNASDTPALRRQMYVPSGPCGQTPSP